MKHPGWREYTSGTRWRAIADELMLETNNGTSKADLMNMVRFLAAEAGRLQAKVYELEEKVTG